MHADDGTQQRTIEAIEAAMAVRDVSNGEIARYLGISPSQWSNVKSGHQVLAPWMLRKIAKRLQTAAPAVGQVIAVTGETLAQELDDSVAAEPLSKGIQLSAQMTGLTAAIAAYQVDGIDAEELADLERRHSEIAAGLSQLRAGLRPRVVTR